MATPQIEKQPDGHEPEVLRAHAHWYCGEIEKSGKGFFVRYPTATFFAFSSSLSILRLVPRNMASVIASL